MKKVLLHISRFFLGIIFLLAGINGYFVILSLDPFIATSAEAMVLFEFKYLLIAEKTIEVICGILLLLNQFTPLAIATLTPIVANIFLLHVFVDQSLLLLAILLVIALAYMLFSYRSNFIRIFERKVNFTES